MSLRSLAHRYVITSAVVLLFANASPATSSATDGVVFDELPSEYQLFPRQSDGTATVSIRGSAERNRYLLARLRVEQDGRNLHELTTPLTNRGGRSHFSFEQRLAAGLTSYRFVVEMFDGRRWQTAADRGEIVVGDVYLVQGQSNAVATDYHFEGLANQNQRNWIRSFGTASTVPAQAEADLNWYIADGLGANGPGTIGAWALKSARQLSEKFQIPIAVLNGAVGGTAIDYHLRDDARPGDLDTNYGRLLYRAEKSGLRQAARTLIWYQGESDTNNVEPWVRDFGELYDDWREDFPKLEQIYVFQIRSSCGFGTNLMQHTQRRLPELFRRVNVMSTTAAPEHDGCHFFFSGYGELADRLTRVIGRDLYDSKITENIEPPNIDFAFYSSPARDEITLVFKDPNDELTVDPGAEADFWVNDSADIVSAEVFGNTIVLGLSEPSSASEVEYRGHSGDGPWVTNARGVGALTFSVPIGR